MLICPILTPRRGINKMHLAAAHSRLQRIPFKPLQPPRFPESQSSEARNPCGIRLLRQPADNLIFPRGARGLPLKPPCTPPNLPRFKVRLYESRTPSWALKLEPLISGLGLFRLATRY